MIDKNVITKEAVPAVEFLAFKKQPGSQPRSLSDLLRVRYEQGTWHTQRLFAIGDIAIKEIHLSPDRKSLYVLADRVYWGEISQGKLRDLTPAWEYYYCLFSPDSKFLAGCRAGITSPPFAYELVVFDLRRGGRKKRLSTGAVGMYGWYPDSRHLWYEPEVWDEKTETYRQSLPLSFRRVAVSSDKRQVLSQKEMRALTTDWDLLNPAFHGILGKAGGKRYAYSRNSQVRLIVEPFPFEPRSPGEQTLTVEWRKGRQKMVLRRKAHSWRLIHPLDVTADGRWGLLIGQHDQNQKLVLIDLLSGQQKTLFSIEIGGEVGEFRLIRGESFRFG